MGSKSKRQEGKNEKQKRTGLHVSNLMLICKGRERGQKIDFRAANPDDDIHTDHGRWHSSAI